MGLVVRMKTHLMRCQLFSLNTKPYRPKKRAFRVFETICICLRGEVYKHAVGATYGAVQGLTNRYQAASQAFDVRLTVLSVCAFEHF